MFNNAIQPNRNYQDTLFRKLFSTKDKIIELYNALEDSHYGPDTSVEITTLEDVVYIDRKNDLGFLIDDRFVVLAEHQSSVNPNIPVRQFVYIGKTMEHLIKTMNIYGHSLQKIPVPEFYILYTGDEEWDVKTLRLSDSFMEVPPENSMELVVKFINLRYNEENEILKRSETLKGYSRLIFYVRANLKEDKNLRDAISLAISRCIRENYLSDFLQKYSQEVGNMLFEEITWEQFAELRAKEAADEAAKDSFIKGIEQEKQTIIKNMLRKGIADSDIIELTSCNQALVDEIRNAIK